MGQPLPLLEASCSYREKVGDDHTIISQTTESILGRGSEMIEAGEYER
jgi:hypothetical protein